MNTQPEVILFQEDEKALGYRYALQKGFKLDPNISIKSIDYDVDETKNRYLLIGDQPKLNSVFYKHPYLENTYVNESENEIYFLKEKVSLFKEFGKLLGAKTIDVKIVRTQTEERQVNINGEVSYKLVETKGEFDSNTRTTLEDSIEINDVYIQEENFNLYKNLELLKERMKSLNLHNETDLRDLIRDRDSRESGTILTKRVVRSELSSEFNKVTSISASLTATPVFSLSTNFKNNVCRLNKINVDIAYMF